VGLSRKDAETFLKRMLVDDPTAGAGFLITPETRWLVSYGRLRRPSTASFLHGLLRSIRSANGWTKDRGSPRIVAIVDLGLISIS